MFMVEFDELPLTIEAHRFSYPIDGEADIADDTDRKAPHVYAIRLRANNKRMIDLPEASPLFRPLAAAILDTCRHEISERFETPKTGQSYADEHRLGMRELL